MYVLKCFIGCLSMCTFQCMYVLLHVYISMHARYTPCVHLNTCTLYSMCCIEMYTFLYIPLSQLGVISNISSSVLSDKKYIKKTDKKHINQRLKFTQVSVYAS